MIDAKELAAGFERNVQIIKTQCNGLTHEDSLRQAPFNINCLNWVVGHIAQNRDTVLRLLGAEPALGEAGNRYRRESSPIADESADVLPLDRLLASLELGQERISAALSNAIPDNLNRQVEFQGRQRSVGSWLFFLYFHDSYHTGQTDLLRQILGKNDKII
jgi:hypothetical protein